MIYTVRIVTGTETVEAEHIVLDHGALLLTKRDPWSGLIKIGAAFAPDQWRYVREGEPEAESQTDPAADHGDAGAEPTMPLA